MDCGADVAFMESPRTEDECRRLLKALAPHPVLINILPNGLTPGLTTKQCTEIGFKMVIYPCTGFIPAMLAMQRSYAGLKNEGSDLQYCEGKKIPDFFEQMGLKAAFDFDQDVVQFTEKDIGAKYGEKAEEKEE